MTTQQQIFAPQSRAKKAWTAKEITTLLDKKGDGLTHREIGVIMGRSTKSINVRWGKLRQGIDAGDKPVANKNTSFEKQLDETLFGESVVTGKTKRKDAGKKRGPYKPRQVQLSLSPQPTPADTFTVPKSHVYLVALASAAVAVMFLGSIY
tara:strand:+ start:591 stop:1043 length:453 start_codon:yes stop_codon:yes gene_type:complete